MAYLNLNAIEPVGFGSKECAPRIDAETKMRLSAIKTYDEQALAVLASAFPEDEEYVKEFLGRMATIDVETLHAYLLGGPTMVERMWEKIKNEIEKADNKEAK